MRRTRGLAVATFAVALTAVLTWAAPAGAADEFKENAIGDIRVGTACAPTPNNVCIDTGTVSGAVWFGLRVFTAAPGLMTSHTGLKTSNTAYRYGSVVGATFPCISDFQGSGTSNGSGVPAAPLDPGIAMIGGFVGSSTGCTDTGLTTGSKVVKFQFTTTGQPTFAFYGAFWGTDAADWRGQVGSSTGNAQWWNLWGNFEKLGYATSQSG